MRPVLFHLGSVPVYSFGVLMSLAFLVAGGVMQGDFARSFEVRIAPQAYYYFGPFGLLGEYAGLPAHRGPAASGGGRSNQR